MPHRIVLLHRSNRLSISHPYISTYAIHRPYSFSSIMAMNVMSSSHALVAVGDVVAQRERDLFEELVMALKEGLGPSSGLTSEDVDVDSLMEMMRAYDGSDMQWSKYAFGDASRGYTRNLVDEGNGKSNLVSHASSPTLE
ncbi:uncharacterized protein TrAtP1_001394 [Trichoderma atroviride]|uniref:uncharacterized protein n=1 Tax=Hypocrea atroviridis TaxID=63577 RepID=UPI0033319DA1|nr:hypothetical protein TrAtP1_001394 [Trichoderma atroviride]